MDGGGGGRIDGNLRRVGGGKIDFEGEMADVRNPAQAASLCLNYSLFPPHIGLCSNNAVVYLTPRKVTRVHADINAAQNLQRRFWTRHGDAFRVSARKVLIDGKEAWVPTRLGKRLVGSLGGFGHFIPTGDDNGSCRWEPLTRAKWERIVGESASTEDIKASVSAEDEVLAGIEEEMVERKGDYQTFFRDPSGTIFPGEQWYPAKVFWSVVKQKTARELGIGV